MQNALIFSPVMARAEFGRFYRDEAQLAELIRAMSRKPATVPRLARKI
jgi:hypothetical protein